MKIIENLGYKSVPVRRKNKYIQRDKFRLAQEDNSRNVDVFVASFSESNSEHIIFMNRTLDEAIKLLQKHSEEQIYFIIDDNLSRGRQIANTLVAFESIPENDGIIIVVSTHHMQTPQLSEFMKLNTIQIVYANVDGRVRSEVGVDGVFVEDNLSPTGLMYYGGGINPMVSNYSAYLSLAISVVNCCYGGYGTPAGVDWKHIVSNILADEKRLRETVAAASLGFVSLPEKLPQVNFTENKKTLLTKFLITSKFKVHPRNHKKLVDVFFGHILEGGDQELIAAAKHMQAIKQLWADVPTLIDDDIEQENINPDASDIAKRINCMDDKIGMKSYIEAYMAGVSLHDLIL